MMNQQNYYYLVAGLPDLALEQNKLPFTPLAFVDELRSSLHPDDFNRVQWLLYPVDHGNLLNLLQKTDSPWQPGGNFSREQMDAALQEPEGLPAHLATFYQAYRSETPVWPRMSWENQLTRLYYEAAIEENDGFLRNWFLFDQHLRNILTAWNVRTHQLSEEGQLVGRNEVTEAIRQSHARDFGLSGEWPFIDKLLHALEQEDLLEREKDTARIRWNYIDELNTFHYFDIDVLLGYLLKLMLLDRWTGLEEQKGEEAIENLLRELENSFEFPAKFT